jgi:hypothetical protein
LLLTLLTRRFQESPDPAVEILTRGRPLRGFLSVKGAERYRLAVARFTPIVTL